MVWKKFDVRSQTIMLRGSAPAENGDKLLKASAIAEKRGMIITDSEFPFVSFCVAFTVDRLLEMEEKLSKR